MPSLLLATAAATPHLGGASGSPASFVRVVASLIICLIIAALAALLIRQRSGAIDLPSALRRLAPKPGRIEVVETRRVSPHADVCLLRHGNCEYLLLLQAGSAQVLSEAAAAASKPEAPPCD